MTNKILNFGSLNVDYVYQVDNFVSPGETKLAKSLQIFSGGKGNNQSIALARAGAQVYHAGCVGSDGNFLVENLKKEGVNTDYININKNINTGHAIIQVNQQGENCILLHGGANQEIKPSYFEKVLKNFNSNDILLIQNEISHLDKLIELAGQKKMTIYFNPAPMDNKVLNYPLGTIDTFIVNQSEAKALTKINNIDDINNIDTIAIKVRTLLPNSKIILTLGDKGVVYIDKEKIIKQQSYKVDTIDTTAAGDTFLGYFIAAQQKNLDIKQSLELGCLAASIAVTREGAASSIPFLRELDLKYGIM